MAATNYTPIQLYFSTTASAVPTAANLAQGELAINITDGKLYYEDNSGSVQVIATKGAGTIGGSTTQIQYNNAGALAGNAAMVFNNSTNVTTLTTLNLTNALGAIYGGTAQSTYTQGDVLYASAANTLSKLGIGASTYILTSNGTVPQWVAPSSISVLTATNLAGGVAGSVPYQSGVATTTFLGIGAANRVMTSTGTAPQWVTALSNLTGVSSSSITNTSLTSGRVVVSTTAGLQADDADLTFDGTTLSAGGLSTGGLSTLVKTVKIGDSGFSGVAVFAPATPAKLYMGTGTVTDVTSAISATNTTGAIASLDITPIAASNTGVTYTNASTLYIAGAPSAGTNITITNPYSLYVAGGAAYFGGALTAGATGVTTLTTSGNVGFGLASTAAAGFAMQLTASGASPIGIQDRNSITATAGSVAYRMALGDSGAVTANTGGAMARIASLAVNEPNITVSSGSVSEAVTLYVSGAPTEGSSNYALKVASGATDLQATSVTTLIGSGGVGSGATAATSTFNNFIYAKAASGGAAVVLQDTGVTSKFELAAGATGANAFGIYDTTASAYRVIINSTGGLTIGSTAGTGSGALFAGATSVTTLTASGLVTGNAGAVFNWAGGTGVTFNRTDGSGFIDLNATNGVKGAQLSSTGTGGFQLYTNIAGTPTLAMSVLAGGSTTLNATNVTTLTATGTATVGNNISAGTLILGDATPSINASSFLRFQSSNTARNWEVSVNQLVVGALSFTPSTALGGTTFTTPVLDLYTTGAQITGGLSATGNATIGSAVTTTGMVLGVDTGGSIAAGATSGDAVIRAAVGAGTTNRILFAQGSSGTQYGMFDGSGNLLVGTATAFTTGFTAGADGRIATTITNAALPNIQYWSQATSGDNKFAEFYTEGGGGSLRGSITYNRAGGLVAYNVTSDYRAKDITGKYEASGETIDQLQVYMGKMKGATIARPMMIAHEAASVVPYAVTGEKDAEDEDGKPIYQSMDHQIFVPLLIAEVQALRSRVALLEAK